MGAKQSALKKEIALLHQEARKRSAKHQEELDAAAKEKRLLHIKLDELLAIATLAQEEAEKLKSEAHEQEERMKALKWELVRQLRMTGSPTSTGRRASLSPLSSTRIALNWRLNEDVSLRQSVVSPKKASNNEKDTDSSVNALAAQAAIVSDTPAETPRNPVSLLAPRRSFLKNPESASRAVSSPNQASDADAKETPTSPDATSRPTPSSTSPRDSMDRTEDIPPLNRPRDTASPRESKSESKDESKSVVDSEDDAKSTASHPAERKDSDATPETNDVLSFSDESS